MATGTFKLFEGEYGENSLAFMPEMKEDRLIDILMYLVSDPDKRNETEEYLLSFGFADIVLLRDYLTSVINLYEKKSQSASN